jgi:Ca2+-transporting ATPase
MATVTDFCLDMTGTITQDRMTVVSGLVGIRTQFALRRAGHAAGYQPQNDQLGVIEDIEALDIRLSVSPPLQCLLNNIITLTSIATQDVDPFTGDIMFLGDVTEIALLQFAKEFEWPDIQSVRSAANILDVVPFSSERMASGAFVDIGEGRRRLYMKGASEILAKRCTRYIHVDEELQEDLRPKMPTFPIGGYAEGIINATLTSYTKQGLRTLALCYRDFESWPPDDMPNDGVSTPDYYTFER